MTSGGGTGGRAAPRDCLNWRGEKNSNTGGAGRLLYGSCHHHVTSYCRIQEGGARGGKTHSYTAQGLRRSTAGWQRSSLPRAHPGRRSKRAGFRCPQRQRAQAIGRLLHQPWQAKRHSVLPRLRPQKYRRPNQWRFGRRYRREVQGGFAETEVGLLFLSYLHLLYLIAQLV